jgi:putative membrane protein
MMNPKNTEKEHVCENPSSGKRLCDKDDLKTHLANERTFLAWCRTSISLVVFGFVVGKFELFVKWADRTDMLRLLTELRLIALFCFILAGAIIMIAGWEFFYLRKKILQGEISLSAFPEIMVVLSMILIICMVILLVGGNI